MKDWSVVSYGFASEAKFRTVEDLLCLRLYFDTFLRNGLGDLGTFYGISFCSIKGERPPGVEQSVFILFKLDTCIHLGSS